MTEREILDGLITREAGWRDQVTRPNGTVDPPTNRGITLPTLQQYKLRYLGTPVEETTIETLRALTDEEARQIYSLEFIEEPGFTHANIPFEPLRVQLIDFGVNASPARAIRWLQRVLRVPVTGVMDAETVGWFRGWGGYEELLGQLTNDALVAARSYMIDQAVDQGSMRKADEEGVESRALSFFLAKP